MARECYVTKKRTRSGNNVSFSKNRTKRTFKPNLQKVKIIDDDGTVKKVYVSTRALKSGLVKRA
ncbi:MAG: 50S ribosomal protein L28 [Candidatus Izimaplasma sp.]|nr:50S ribosomal protein L28 [Candidatus Izimaplasma bacterium]